MREQKAKFRKEKAYYAKIEREKEHKAKSEERKQEGLRVKILKEAEKKYEREAIRRLGEKRTKAKHRLSVLKTINPFVLPKSIKRKKQTKVLSRKSRIRLI